jgi:hypothetical protein
VAPEVTVSQEALDAAVQAQLEGALTDVKPVPPAAATEALVDESVNEQPCAACVTEKV